MNTLCLDNYGVSEMEIREMKDTNGGAPWWRIVRAIAVAYAAANEACDNCLNESIADPLKSQAGHAGSSSGGKYGGAFHY